MIVFARWLESGPCSTECCLDLVLYFELALSARLGVLLGYLTKVGQQRRSQVKFYQFVHVTGDDVLCE